MAKKPDLAVAVESHEVSGVIEKGCEFEGKLCFEGTLRIGGTFRGEIYTNDVLVIGEGAKVSAEIEAGTIIINGEVTGNIVAKHRVEIHRPAIFRGNIVTPSLMVDEGVIFEGSSKMVSPKAPAVKSFLATE
ncbi:MAG: polymer-forming cytoskeletal protein [Deltaproteobacteria bacterium]|nr:polymer-forming cytoskeletal protein [Deltaproteobacteria bacterium]